MELLVRTCHTERMNIERLIARVFVAGGGVFWAIAAFSAELSYNDKPLAESVGSALIPLGIALFALVLGWYYEVLAAAFLFAAATAVIVWGVVVEWESGMWLVGSSVLIAPMVIAGVLYLLAARMQRICVPEDMSAS